MFFSHRFFEPRDARDRPDVAVVSESLARRYWPRESALGKRLFIDEEHDRWREIIGVVSDIKNGSLDMPSAPTLYAPLSQNTLTVALNTPMHLVLRLNQPAGTVLPKLRALLHSLDPDLAFGRVQSFDEILSQSNGSRRLQTTLLGLFAGIGGFLALVGIYGVTAHGVEQRTRELGVRIALGANRRQILLLVLGQNVRPVLFGVAGGAILAAAASRFLTTQLFGTTGTDPVVYLGIGAAFLATAVAASWFPAARATRIDPAVALRAE